MKATSIVLATVACAAIFGWRLGGAFRPSTGPDFRTLTASPDLAFVDGSRPGATGRVTFTLSNQSPTALTILGIERSCACVVATDLRGKRLEPGEECRLEMVMTIPDRGLEKQQIDVVHDGPLSPLRLTAEVLGRQHLPYVMRTPVKAVNFFAIDSTAPTATFTVITCEPLGGRPWVKALTCDMPEVRVESLKDREEPYGSVVIRTYQYRIGWTKLPSASAFHGNLSLEVEDNRSSAIAVGSVASTKLASTCGTKP